MMRIAIAGSGGLARVIAYHVSQTSHPFYILSRQPQPTLTAQEYQVVVANYDDQQELREHLRGVDLVISTVSGNPQINLIDAAAASGVRRFCPAEFEGPPARRRQNDPLDRGKAVSLERLKYWSRRTHMKNTIFTCGVFYERFARGGLASMGIGGSTSVAYQGSYLMDVGEKTAEIVEKNLAGQPISISMISVHDVGRFIAAALDIGLQNWLGEYRMAGDRRTVSEVLRWAEAARGGEIFSTEIFKARDLNTHLEHAIYYQDYPKVARFQELIATEQRRYDFSSPNLNALVDVRPMSFWDWLNEEWA